MVLTEEDNEIKIIRDEKQLNRRMASGCNDRGMIAWEMHLWTPDAPNGRKVIII